MLDFIQFKSFIAQDVLIIFYIIMALLLPIVCWLWLLWIVRRYAVMLRLYQGMKRSIIISLIVWLVRKVKLFQQQVDQRITWQTLNSSQKLKLISIFVLMVFFSELFLRLTFEYLIAFMQMHEVLSAKC